MTTELKKQFADRLAQYLPLTTEQIIELIQTPPDNIAWDLAFPCFTLAKELKQSPQIIAKEIAEKLSWGIFEKIENIWPYINAHIAIGGITDKILESVMKQKDRYGQEVQNNQHIVIESPWPNTNKPLHLGHIRNMLLWNALANIYNRLGYKVTKVDIINDRGIHICKSMLAYKLFANNASPNKKSDHFVGDRYVRYAIESEKNPSLKEEIQKMLILRENKDKETRDLRSKMNKRAVDWMYQTYKRFGTHIDKAYYESEHYLKGKTIVEQNISNGIFHKHENGKITFKTQYSDTDEKVIIRADGTSIYITQDIALAKIRYEDLHMDQMIYIVGNEQIYHFQVLFEILEKLWYPFAQWCYHLAYGMVVLPEGKMKSREGKVVDADNLADEMHQNAYNQIKERHENIQEQEAHNKAEAIAMAAIKFYVLNHEASKDFTFDPTQSLSFEGETWPYIQYTYARCMSIINRVTKSIKWKKLASTDEKKIVLKIGEFAEIINKAGQQYRPSVLTKYLFELAQLFNNYYQKQKIVWSDTERERCMLTQSVAQVLKNGLNILGIEVLEQM